MVSSETGEEIEATTQSRETINLRPVASEESGEGLPYAPVDWPDPGDTWTWKVGKRVSTTGHYLDRYLYLPPLLCFRKHPTCPGLGFGLKSSVEQYIRLAFPGADIESFFASFSWEIPARHEPLVLPGPAVKTEEDSDSQLVCKAGNSKCNSLVVQAGNQSLAAMPCEFCCSEPLFCLDCCCILCSKTVYLAYGGYSYVKCEEVVKEGYICGHAAHVRCALKAGIVGKVEGRKNMDAQYYCRRCKAKTDMIPHVKNLLLTCRSLKSRLKIEIMLKVGSCILHGTEKFVGQLLQDYIEMSLQELQAGTDLEEIWSMEAVALSTDYSPEEDATPEDNLDDTTSVPNMVSVPISYDYEIEPRKLEEEIDQVLERLRKLQESGYKIVKESLYAQKKYLQNLYQQLGKDRSELEWFTLDSVEALLEAVMSRMELINKEVKKLKGMEVVANGFARTCEDLLKECFGFVREQ